MNLYFELDNTNLSYFRMIPNPIEFGSAMEFKGLPIQKTKMLTLNDGTLMLQFQIKMNFILNKQTLFSIKVIHLYKILGIKNWGDITSEDHKMITELLIHGMKSFCYLLSSNTKDTHLKYVGEGIVQNINNTLNNLDGLTQQLLN